MNYSRSFAFTLLLIGIILSVPAQAGVGDACTVANRIHTSEGATTDVLICDGATMTQQTARSLKGNPIREGIRTDDPKATLDVNGEMKIGNSGIACSATTEGSFRWNSTDKVPEVCDGTVWGKIQAAACDNTPAFPFFEDQTNLAVSTLTTSNIVNSQGWMWGCNTDVTISGTGGSPEYRTCSDSGCSTEVQTWTAANNSLDIQGDYLQLRATSSASLATAFTITVNVGATSSDWVISTGMSGCSPEGTVCADGTVYAGLSGAATPMYVTRCDAGQTWSGAACTGTRSTLPWNNGNGSGYVDTTLSNGGTTDGQAYTATLITEDSDSVVGGTQPHQAAQYCADLVIHGHSDWYPPAKNELNTMYTNEVAIVNFDTSGTYYWSSSENSLTNALIQRFSAGTQTLTTKDSTRLFRCARR